MFELTVEYNVLKQATNLNEFKDLIATYQKITRKQILNLNKNISWNTPYENFDTYGEEMAYKLTGFGSMESCTLCKAVTGPSDLNPKCHHCAWGGFRKCLKGPNEKTYQMIFHARTPQELYHAIKMRALYMQMYLDNLVAKSQSHERCINV